MHNVLLWTGFSEKIKDTNCIQLEWMIGETGRWKKTCWYFLSCRLERWRTPLVGISSPNSDGELTVARWLFGVHLPSSLNFWQNFWNPSHETVPLNQGFGSGSAWIRINLSCWIRFRIRIQIADPDPDPGGQKWPTKIEKSPEFHVFKYWMFSFEGWGFSCSLGDLYGGLGISKLQFLIKKIEIKFPAINFFSILGHQTLDPDPGSAIRKNAGSGSVSGSALNQCGSETLL